MKTQPGRDRAMPRFVIAGVQKCGTTSLFQALALHPHVVRPDNKEIHFFDQNWRRGTDWYQRQFPVLDPLQITGESTPAYSYDRTARRRMARTLPDARIIMVLRDPVSRAYSHYWHSRRTKEDLPTFEEAIAAEPARLATGDAAQRRRFSYLDRGHYLRQLKALHGAHGDALMVTSLEALMTSPETELARVMRHVGLDPQEADELLMPEVNRHRTLSRSEERSLRDSRRNRLWRRLFGRDYIVRDRDRPAMDPATRERLRRHFAEPDRKLLAWLQWERLPWESLANPVTSALDRTTASTVDLTHASMAEAGLHDPR